MQYTSNTFYSVRECIDYIVPFVLAKTLIITRLVRLETDKGIVITDMPIFRYYLNPDMEDHHTSLNRLEFRDGAKYDYIAVDKFFGWVTANHIGLGTLTSIEITVEVPVHHHHCEEGVRELLSPIPNKNKGLSYNQ